ncbi:type II toxin-antitoxin system YhaV family toxin [Thermodesulfobacteriota bacterium]
MKINGWEILLFATFHEQYERLVSRVASLRAKDPSGYRSHPQAKLLAKVQRVIREDVPQDPQDKKFFVGRALGSEYANWRRVKNILPPRFRMFFRFSSSSREIIFVWMNDEHTLRKEGGKSDVYAEFRKLIKSGKIPNDYAALIENAQRAHSIPEKTT